MEGKDKVRQAARSREVTGYNLSEIRSSGRKKGTARFLEKEYDVSYTKISESRDSKDRCKRRSTFLESV